ncbi:hypothetical protein Bca101_034228 [Brassica carinata]
MLGPVQKYCGHTLKAGPGYRSPQDDPIYGTQISEVLNSKFSACAVFKDCSVTSNEFKATTSNGDALSINLHANSIGEQGSSGILVRKKKQDLVNSLPQIENKVNKTSLPQTEKQGGPGVLLDDTQCVSGHLPGAVTISSRDHFKVFLCEYAKNFTISLRTTTGKIKFQEATKPASQQIGEFVPAPAAAHNPCNDSIFSRKRRRKNKEKANKRLRAENK